MSAALCLRDVEALIRQMPSLLDQDYDGLCEEVHVGNGRKIITAARRVYHLHCLGSKSFLGNDREILDARLQQAAYALNALIDCHDSESCRVDAHIIKKARELFERVAVQLGTNALVLQRACV